MATSTSGLSLPGLGSGLDINSLVSQLMAVERRPLDLLTAAAQKTQAKVSAFGQLKSLLATFQGSMQSLTAESFGSLKAAVGDSTIASATATAGATVGSHTLEVATLASAQKLKSTPFQAATDVVGTGTLTFEFGTFDGTTFAPNAAKPAKTVTIAAGQDTLAGVRDAINAAAVGVSASLVDDGTGPRLVLASADTGTASTLRITTADGDGTSVDAAGLSRLAYDPAAAVGAGRNLIETAAAADATFNLDGIAIRRGSNVVSDALDGVTITLAKGAPGTVTSLSVSRDTTAMQSGVDQFVKAWNDVANTLSTMTAYDATKKTAGTLQGDSLALQVESQLRRVLGSTPTGPAGALTTLAQVGVSLQKDGTLKLDATKLQKALAATPEAVAQLFGAVAKSSDSRLSVLGMGANTASGTHAVVVTQAATRGTLSGSAVSAPLNIQAGINDQLTILVDGVSTTVTLDARVYASAGELAAEVQSKLNGSAMLSQAGAAVDAVASGGALTLSSRRYGAASSVMNASGSAAVALFGAAPASQVGLDVAGTIDGAAATGTGRTLVAGAGTPADGLRLEIAATAAGAFGQVSVTRGFADLLGSAASRFLGDDGGIAGRVDGLNSMLKLNQKRQDEESNRLTDTETRMRKQFTQLDLLISQMNNTSTFLTQQLAALQTTSN